MVLARRSSRNRSPLFLIPFLLPLAACPPTPPPPTVSVPVFGDLGLTARVESAEAQIAAAGGKAEGRWGPFFLNSGTQIAQPLTLEAGSCWLLLGLTGGRIGDLDLFLYALGGRRIDLDQERDAHPVVVHCPEENLQAVAVLMSYDGDGEAFLGAYRFPRESEPRRGDIDFEDVQPAAAPSAGTPEESLARMNRLMGAEGFRPLEETDPLELGGQGEVSRTHRIPAGRCLGVALVGDDGAIDLDLRMMLGTRKVAEDRETTRDAHVGYCSETEVDVRVLASSAQGAAGGTLIYYDAAPEERVFVTPSELPEEPTTEGQGGGATFEQAALDLDRRMRAGGYEPLGEPLEGTLATGEAAAHELQLARGSCYEIHGAARPDGVRDLDLMLDDTAGNRVAEDRLETNDPQISFCPEATATYALQVQAYDGSGAYAVRIYRLGAVVRDIPGITGRLASAYGRTAAELYTKDFHPMGTPDRRPAESGRQNAHPLMLHYGSCYVVVALASAEDMDVDVEVRDYMMRSISVDVGGEPDARVFVCPDRSAEYYANVTVATGSGQYMLAVFESKSEAAGARDEGLGR
jgi:hypothetical protein